MDRPSHRFQCPLYANISQGCEVPPPSQTVCGQNDDQKGHQIGCKLGLLSPWSVSAGYVPPAINGVRSWIDDTPPYSCAGTQQGSNPTLLKMSIVDDGTNNPTFVYPNTAMGAWLCQSVQNPDNDCVHHFDQNHCLNNTSPQGQIFYGTITKGDVQPPKSYWIYAVQNCNGPEGVTDSMTTVPGYTNGGLSNPNGMAAIENDMVSDPINGCVKN
jgi:hypothetical protein